MAAQKASDFMEVWPGPRIMVPMPTDLLLVGEQDLMGDTPVQALSSTKLNYSGLFLNQEVEPAPFTEVSKDTHLQVGAHLMWTLPHTLRLGKQVKNADGTAETSFPLVPNRWLITRLEYKDIASGAPPAAKSFIIASDSLGKGLF